MKVPARSLAFGALAATALVVPLFAGAGCDVQDLQAQPDAAPEKCDAAAHVFCDPVSADQPHCSSDDTSSPYLAKLPRGQNYPVGCYVNYPGERDQIGGDCKLEEVCRCLLPDLSVPTDAGVDAAEAGLATPAPTATGAPVWDCQ